MDGICVPSESCKVDDGECPYRYRNSGDSLTDKEDIKAKQGRQLILPVILCNPCHCELKHIKPATYAPV